MIRVSRSWLRSGWRGRFLPAAIDELLDDADDAGIGIDGPEGLVGRMTKALLERALDAELANHLGYDAGDPAGWAVTSASRGQ